MKTYQFKVSIIGFLALNSNYSGGQEVKTRGVFEHCQSKYGPENVTCVDTLGWKKHPARMLIQTIRTIKKSESIIICPARRGIRIFGPLIYFLSKTKKQKIFYAVVGGWLPSLLSKKRHLLATLSKYTQVFVETRHMQTELNLLGMNNVSILRNSKNVSPLPENSLQPIHFPIRVCTFSRINSMKGIEDAIEAVNIANAKAKRDSFQLTIFGQVEPDYEDRFEKLKASFSAGISYGGLIPPLDSVKILQNYDVLLFPTHYFTEGFPGTVVDGFASGLIILASRIPSIQELISEGGQGYTFEMGNINEITHHLLLLLDDSKKSNEMKRNSLNSFDQFSFDKIFANLDRWMDTTSNK
jgi:Glycosyltransferase